MHEACLSERQLDSAVWHAATEVPDPYYGGAKGFEQVLDLAEDACAGDRKSVV